MNSDTTTPATGEPRPVPREGDGWQVSAGTDDKTRCYPQAESYTWSEFAGVAIQSGDQPIVATEMGGYGDMTMVDPYTHQRLWMGAIRDAGGTIVDETIYDQLRRLIDLAEREQFLG